MYDQVVSNRVGSNKAPSDFAAFAAPSRERLLPHFFSLADYHLTAILWVLKVLLTLALWCTVFLLIFALWCLVFLVGCCCICAFATRQLQPHPVAPISDTAARGGGDASCFLPAFRPQSQSESASSFEVHSSRWGTSGPVEHTWQRLPCDEYCASLGVPDAENPCDSCSDFPASSKHPDPVATPSQPSQNARPAPECSICLVTYASGDVLCTLPCAHQFHKGCVCSWLKEHNSCPLCRTEIR